MPGPYLGCSRLKVLIKILPSFNGNPPRIGNYCKRANVRSKNSREATLYDIIMTININSQFTELTVM